MPKCEPCELIPRVDPDRPDWTHHTLGPVEFTAWFPVSFTSAYLQRGTFTPRAEYQSRKNESEECDVRLLGSGTGTTATPLGKLNLVIRAGFTRIPRGGVFADRADTIIALVHDKQVRARDRNDVKTGDRVNYLRNAVMFPLLSRLASSPNGNDLAWMRVVSAEAEIRVHIDWTGGVGATIR